MAESVDAPVSNTGGAIHPGSIPGPGTQNIDDHWKDAGVVDRGGLENRCSLTGTQGSNPCPSAKQLQVNNLQLLLFYTRSKTPTNVIPLQRILYFR